MNSRARLLGFFGACFTACFPNSASVIRLAATGLCLRGAAFFLVAIQSFNNFSRRLAKERWCSLVFLRGMLGKPKKLARRTSPLQLALRNSL